MAQSRTWKKIFTLVLFTSIMISGLIPFVSASSTFEENEKGLSEDEIKLIETSEGLNHTRLYVPYRDEYRTLKYEGWETYSDENGEVTVATEKVVVRRGSVLSIRGHTDAEHRLNPSKEDMDELEVNEVEDGWEVEIPEDANIGRYDFEIVEDDWSEEIEIFVIFDPWQLDIPEEKIKGYAYDEDGTRDEYGYILTTSYNVYPQEEHPPNLAPFGDEREDRPSIFELALAGAGNSSDAQESAARLNRIVAQRNDAKPTGLFHLRDASDILFYGEESPYTRYLFDLEKREENITEGEMPDWLRTQFEEKNVDLPEDAIISRSGDRWWVDVGEERIGEIEVHGEILRIYDGPVTHTNLDGEVKDVEGLTLDDAEKLAMNGVSIHELESQGRSKIINGWCDEVSFALVSLLRSIGIPSRVVSIHPTPEVDRDLMGHFMVEAWFEESIYETSWENDYDGGWYVLDPDEWNARWHTAEPEFWMPVGEKISSRKNYMRTVDVLFQDRWETLALYTFGPEDKMYPETVDITDAYVDAGEHELEYGSVSKMIGRGGGDLYKINIEEPTKISVGSDAGAEARIYVSEDDYPAIPTATEGYPFEEPPEYEGEEAILLPDDSDTFYVGIYAPQNGDRTVEGNFGYYTLTVEEADEEDIMDEHQRLKDDEEMTREHLYAVVLLIVWVAAYAGKKKL